MSRLRIFSSFDASKVLFETRNPNAITTKLREIGVRFERWQAAVELRPGASPELVLSAYQHDIAHLMKVGGYQSVDVVSLYPEHPDRAAMRQKFLNEHTHSEDEVRFFVAGSGLFTIHAKTSDGLDQIYEVECQKNDLINLPAGTQHWFDMGDSPFFVAIRIFTDPGGWVANFTGSTLSENFPRYEREAA